MGSKPIGDSWVLLKGPQEENQEPSIGLGIRDPPVIFHQLREMEASQIPNRRGDLAPEK